MGIDFATGFFRCPRCGHDVFICYPQTVVLGREDQVWEYTCEKCRCVTAMKTRDWRKKEEDE